MTEFTWHSRPAKEVLDALHSRREGLSLEEAKERLAEQGQNALPKKSAKSGWSILVAQFASPFMIILLFAAVVSFLLKEWVDVTVISLAILVNSLLGFFEEYKADRSLQALKSYLPQEVRVRRGGQLIRIDTKDIVVGDILLLLSGDKVPVDARLFATHAFEVSEAALTGESQSVKKRVKEVALKSGTGDRVSMVFAGTSVTAGRAEAVVTATGTRTELGKISQLVDEIDDEKTPLQQQLDRFAKSLGALLVGLSILIFVIGLLRGFELVEMFYLSVALAVAAVPEGLVVAVTVVLAIGMQRILKKKALVRRLIAAETLGSVGVICMDKTGTLTTGKMEVSALRVLGPALPLDGKQQEVGRIVQLLRDMDDVVMEVDAKTGDERTSGTPTSVALHTYTTGRLDLGRVEKQIVGEIPFTSDRKFAARSFRVSDGMSLSVLGAPDILVRFLMGTDHDRAAVLRVLDELTLSGHRVLLAAERKQVPDHGVLTDALVQDLSLVGFIGLKDPLRDGSAETVQAARDAGLRPVMITGDHPQTAQLIAREAGIDATEGSVMTGAELDEMSDAVLLKRIETTHVFARVIPIHKLRIIQAWQKRGKSVAMTGDGVNDAPALKAADMGIALGSGTEVAKETSDMVLLDNRFATIVDAIREGRIIFDNLRKIVVYLMIGTFSELILVAAALLAGFPLPILPAQILWINLITDGLPGVALGFEPGEKGIMKEPPRKKHAPILNREMKMIILSAGILTDVVLFGVFYYFLEEKVEISQIRTFIYMVVGLSSLGYAFSVRTLRGSIFSSSPFKNRFFIMAMVTGLILQFVPIMIPVVRDLFQLTPLNALEWSLVVFLVLLNLVIIECIKWGFNRKNRLTHG
jgi:calcium-translocating P-type ATPase